MKFAVMTTYEISVKISDYALKIVDCKLKIRI